MAEAKNKEVAVDTVNAELTGALEALEASEANTKALEAEKAKLEAELKKAKKANTVTPSKANGIKIHRATKKD